MRTGTIVGVNGNHLTVEFAGAVTLVAERSLAAATSGVFIASDAVTLSAPYVALGQRVPHFG